MKFNVAIAGATGAVGAAFLDLLEKRNFPIANLKLLASKRSQGKKIVFNNQELTVETLTKDSFKDVDIAFFSAGAERSLEFAPIAAKNGAVVIDNSSAFRLDENVPLVVPEVNPEAAFQHQGIIANPNCTTIQMVVALEPLHRVANLKKVIVATYQSVSGTGANAMKELETQVQSFVKNEPMKHEVYPVPIAFNVLPHVDVFQDNGYTKEEMKMVNETRKIMSLPDLLVSATCVRVPVMRAHSEVVQIETEKKLTAEEAKQILSKAEGVVVQDTRESGGYPTPAEIVETFPTYVGRIREDLASQNGLAFWVVADQLYKGAALNAIQIAELLIKNNKLKA